MLLQKVYRLYSDLQNNRSLFCKGDLQISSKFIGTEKPPDPNINVLFRRFHRSGAEIPVENKEKLTFSLCLLPLFTGTLEASGL